MPWKLMKYFNKSPRSGTLITADKAGNVDPAVFGSPRMTDERTVTMGIGKNRTLANLRQNPHAVYLIREPGASIMDRKGIRNSRPEIPARLSKQHNLAKSRCNDEITMANPASVCSCSGTAYC